MANSEQTKRALAEGLKNCARSQEFDQDHSGGHHRVQ